MKNKILRTLALFMLMTLGSVITLHAQGPATKLGRGLCNILTSPVEIFNNMQRITKESDPVTGLFGGLAAGTAFMVGRVVVGVYETVTFLVPILPRDYEPVLDPPTPIHDIFSGYDGN